MEKTLMGEITAQKPEIQSKIYFDCATNSSERGVVYDEMTPENLSKWFKETKFKFPVMVMGKADFRAWIDRKDGEYVLTACNWDGMGDVTNRWTLRIGKRFTEFRWFGVTRFIQDYIAGDLQERNSWSENKTLRLA